MGNRGRPDKTLPAGEKAMTHSLEAEMSALGSAFFSGKAARIVCSMLTEEMFYSPACRRIFSEIRALAERGCDPDLVLVKAGIQATGDLERIGGTEYLVQVLEAVPSPANAGPYSAIMRDFWVKREMSKRLRKLDAEALGDGTVPDLLRELLCAANGLTRGSQDCYPIQEVELDDLRDLAGVTTGYEAIDRSNEMGGYPKSEVSFVMAGTGVGKSAWMSWSALHAARAPRSPERFSLPHTR